MADKADGGPNYGRILSIISSMALIDGVLYLWGYWGYFDINILEYLNPSDIITASALPLVVMLGSGLFGALFSHSIFAPGGIAHGSVGNPRVSRIFKWLSIPGAIVVGASLVWDYPGRWSVITFILIGPVCYTAAKARILDDVLPNDALRAIFLVVLLVMPGGAYERGRGAARRIASGAEYNYIVTSTLPTETVPAVGNPKNRMRLIGHAGDVYFLWNPTSGNRNLLKLDSKQWLEIAHWPSPAGQAGAYVGPVTSLAPASNSTHAERVSPGAPVASMSAPQGLPAASATAAGVNR